MKSAAESRGSDGAKRIRKLFFLKIAGTLEKPDTGAVFLNGNTDQRTFQKEDLQDQAEENRVYFPTVSVTAGVYDLG